MNLFSGDSCVGDNDCPGNLKCLGDYCACPKHLQQVSTFCIGICFYDLIFFVFYIYLFFLTLIALLYNCSSTNPCPSNQECVLTNGNQNNGMCTCPRGFSLSLDGICKDIDECEQTKNICGLGATCTNSIGSYKCLCPFGGDPYGEGCLSEYVREGCLQDIDCVIDKACIDGKCINPCLETKNNCGQNAVCSVKNHQKECNCKPLFFGDPYSICRKPVGCLSDQNCPGNLICLPDHECGCAFGYERQMDYCISK